VILIVKSSYALITAAALALAGCGQTGPLYMPKRPAKPAEPAVKPVTPVVAPTEQAVPVQPQPSTPVPVQ
jgi:predicted small lipoprotein YifL